MLINMLEIRIDSEFLMFFSFASEASSYLFNRFMVGFPQVRFAENFNSPLSLLRA
jgi:hypothetical protein